MIVFWPLALLSPIIVKQYQGLKEGCSNRAPFIDLSHRKTGNGKSHV